MDCLAIKRKYKFHKESFERYTRTRMLYRMCYSFYINNEYL